MAESRLGPVGQCIYCGASRYSESRVKLGDEHIIPEGLNGTIILDQASCYRCEQMINRFETFCQKNFLDLFRYKFGVKGKKRKAKRKQSEKIEYIRDGIEYLEAVEFKDFPVELVLPWMPMPAIIKPREGGRTNLHRYVRLNFHDPEDVERLFARLKADAIRVRSGAFNTIAFARMLAKIAHAAAAAYIGLDSFTPLLLPVIYGETNFYSDFLIGSSNHFDASGDNGHEIRIGWENVGGTSFVVVDLQLFTGMYWPRYIMVAGVDPHYRLEEVVPSNPLEGKLWGLSKSEIDEKVEPPRPTLYLNTANDTVGGGAMLFTSTYGDPEVANNWRTNSDLDRPCGPDGANADWDLRKARTGGSDAN